MSVAWVLFDIARIIAGLVLIVLTLFVPGHPALACGLAGFIICGLIVSAIRSVR